MNSTLCYVHNGIMWRRKNKISFHIQNKYPIKRRYLILFNTFMLLFHRYSTNHHLRRSKVCYVHSHTQKRWLDISSTTRSFYIFFLLFSLGMSRRKTFAKYKGNNATNERVNETKYHNLMSSQYILRIPPYFQSPFHIHLHNRLNGNITIIFYFKLSSITSSEIKMLFNCWTSLHNIIQTYDLMPSLRIYDWNENQNFLRNAEAYNLVVKNVY